MQPNIDKEVFDRGTSANIPMSQLLRVAGHLIAEKVARARPTKAPDIPGSFGALSAQWLESVLCANSPGATVRSFLTVTESNGTTNRRRLLLTYNDVGQEAGLPEWLFLKTTATFTTRVLNGLSGMLRGEVGFYEQIRPELQIEVPKSYFAAYDPATYRSLIVLEDVTVTRGASFCTTRDELSISQMKGILSLLAKCHARYYASARLTDDFRWLRTPLQAQLQNNAALDFRKLCDRGTARCAEVIPESLTPLGDKIWRAFYQSLTFNERGPQVFLHGDSHIRNFYRTRSGAMRACDWQITMKGHWAFDFSYVVISGLPVEKRRIWERELLTHYLEEFAAEGACEPPCCCALNTNEIAQQRRRS